MNMLRRCYICGKLITSSFYVDWANHAVCSEHRASVKQCVSCGQYCNSSAVDIGLGGKLCSYCQKHLMTKEDCSHVIKYINRIYSRSEIGEIHNWHLKVIDAIALQKRTGSPYTRGLAVRYGNDYTVYIYRHLSKVQFANVLAHELLHIWQYDMNINTIPLLCEGFCNLGSYVVLSRINNREAKASINNMLASTDPIYGEGLRKCIQLFEQGGWANVIRQIKSTPND